jgi:peptidoglycan/xylan/chitin deacetylase (PgdA/CDA1 family)
MKRTILAILIVLLLLVAGFEWYARHQVQVEQYLQSFQQGTQSPDVSAEQATPAPEASATPEATAEASAEPSPGPTVDADWYEERNRELRLLLRRNGSFLNSDEIDAAIAQMGIDPDKPMVALTFDDGPVTGVTNKILDVLEQYHVRATFFVLGVRLKKPEAVALVKRAITLGCEVGNHTWDHQILPGLGVSEIRFQIKSTNQIIYDTTGYTVRLLRPPGGSTGANTPRLAKEQGMVVALWAQSGNVHEFDPNKIAENVQKQIVNGKELHDGDIILLHDTKDRMVPAVELIVPQLLEKGYQLVTVSELIYLSDIGFVPGRIYHSQTE